MPLKAIDFFCSAGGVTCGFKQAGIDVIGGVDIDPACKETYERNNEAKYLCEDVSNLEVESLITEFEIRKNDDELIFVGCSPCQYYSNIKTIKKKSENTRLLLEDFQKFVDYYRPGFVYVENVPGLDKKPESPLGRFKQFLTKNGYIFDDGIVNAKYYGVPQNRRRYMLVATRVSQNIALPQGDRNDIATVRKAIGNKDIYKPIVQGHIDNSSFIHSSARLSEINLTRMRSTKHDGGDRRDWPQSLWNKCHKDRIGHTDVYGRMHWDKPSPTITTRFVSYSNGRYGHPEQDRAISLREGATLQSFPENYIFHSKSQGVIAKMIGNAVPPRLARAVGEIFIQINQ